MKSWQVNKRSLTAILEHATTNRYDLPKQGYRLIVQLPVAQNVLTISNLPSKDSPGLPYQVTITDFSEHGA